MAAANAEDIADTLAKDRVFETRSVRGGIINASFARVVYQEGQCCSANSS